MYSLAYSFDLDYRDLRSVDERVHAIRELFGTLPGVVSVDTTQADQGRIIVVTKWHSRAVAQRALSANGVNDELATRVGIVRERPNAIGI